MFFLKVFKKKEECAEEESIQAIPLQMKGVPVRPSSMWFFMSDHKWPLFSHTCVHFNLSTTLVSLYAAHVQTCSWTLSRLQWAVVTIQFFRIHLDEVWHSRIKSKWSFRICVLINVGAGVRWEFWCTMMVYMFFHKHKTECEEWNLVYNHLNL